MYSAELTCGPSFPGGPSLPDDPGSPCNRQKQIVVQKLNTSGVCSLICVPSIIYGSECVTHMSLA